MIRLNQVSYTYAEAPVPALQEIDLSIEQGEWIVFAGPSGCGKSTLLHLLSGLIPQILGGTLSGNVELHGLEPRKIPLRQWSRQVGTVFQNPLSQIFMLRVADDVAFGCENLAMRPDDTQLRVENALRQLSLTNLRHREIFQLSGGQIQRVALAGALAMGCRTLLLDEPTSDLDPQGRNELLSALSELHQAGHTILMTEHRLDGLSEIVDRIVPMESGRIAPLPFSSPTDTPSPVPKAPKNQDRVNPVSPTDSIDSQKKNVGRPTNGRPVFLSQTSKDHDIINLTTNKPLVLADQISFGYSGRELLLNDLTFQLHPGEMVALTGPNGSGKTTLLKLLAGLLRLHRGSLEIAGTVRPTFKKLIGTVGLVFQNPEEQIFTDRVDEEIAFGPRNFGRSFEADFFLDRTGLERYRHAHPLSLSRGEKQRLVAAAVLAMEPRVLLLDEPTTGLDHRSWHSLMTLITDQMKRLGGCVLFSTHHQDVVETFADRTLFLSNGRLHDDRLS